MSTEPAADPCAGVQLVSRPGVPGLIFPKHNLDITYPGGKNVIIEFLLEAKTIGTPKPPGNVSQKNPLGRPGKSDLPKRIKEAGFKTIDLKAEYGRLMAAHGKSPSGGPSGDVTSWLRSQKPNSYLFVAARLVDNVNDLAQVVQLCDQATLVTDVVGLYCFMPVTPEQPTRYKPVKVRNHLAIDRVLHRTCLDLQGLAGKKPTALPDFRRSLASPRTLRSPETRTRTRTRTLPIDSGATPQTSIYAGASG